MKINLNIGKSVEDNGTNEFIILKFHEESNLAIVYGASVSIEHTIIKT